MNIQKAVRWVAVLLMFLGLRYLAAIGVIVWVGFPFYLKFADNSFGLAAARWFSDAVKSPALIYLSAVTVFFFVVGLGLYRFKRWSVVLVLCVLPLFVVFEFFRWNKVSVSDLIIYIGLLAFFAHPRVTAFFRPSSR